MRKTIIALFVSVLPLFAQGVRVDSNAFTISGTPPPGAYAPVLAVPGASIQVCGDAACSTSATTYSDLTLSTACPPGFQVTLPGSTACVATSAQTGAFGFNIGQGNYWYKVVFPNGQSFGPYAVTAGGTNTFSGIRANGIYVSQTSSGATGTGGYIDIAPVTYPNQTCRDQFGNIVNQPFQVAGLPPFGASDTIMWVSASPLAGVNPPGCANSIITQQVTGLNINGYLWAGWGVATGVAAYNSFQSFAGGINVQSVNAGLYLYITPYSGATPPLPSYTSVIEGLQTYSLTCHAPSWYNGTSWVCANSSSGGGTPGGPVTSVQFQNPAGTFAGDQYFNFIDTGGVAVLQVGIRGATVQNVAAGIQAPVFSSPNTGGNPAFVVNAGAYEVFGNGNFAAANGTLSGKLQIGTLANSPTFFQLSGTNLLYLQPVTGSNSFGGFVAAPSGTGNSAAIGLQNSSDTTNANYAKVILEAIGTQGLLETIYRGTGTPITTMNIGEASEAPGSGALTAVNFNFNGTTQSALTNLGAWSALSYTSTATGAGVGYSNNGGATAFAAIYGNGQVASQWYAFKAQGSPPTAVAGNAIIYSDTSNAYLSVNGGSFNAIATTTNSQTYCQAAGTNTITCAGIPPPVSYTTGMQVTILIANTNSGATTVNINSLGAKAVHTAGGALSGGELVAGNLYTLYYDGTQFNLASATGGVTSFNTRVGAVTLLKADITAVDQALGTGDSPTFAGLTLTGALTGTSMGLSAGLTVDSGTYGFSSGGAITAATAAAVSFTSTATGGSTGYSNNGGGGAFAAIYGNGQITGQWLVLGDQSGAPTPSSGNAYLYATSTQLLLSLNGGAYTAIAGGVTSFNTRTGAVTLSAADVDTAVGQVLTTSGTPSFVSLSLSGNLTAGAGNFSFSNSGQILTISGTTASGYQGPVFSSSNTGANIDFTNSSGNFSINGNGVGAFQDVVTAGLTLNAITGSTQCLTVNAAGVVSGTGAACGAGGGGVTSFNTRTGTVTLAAADVTTAVQGLLTSSSPTFFGLTVSGASASFNNGAIATVFNCTNTSISNCVQQQSGTFVITGAGNAAFQTSQIHIYTVATLPACGGGTEGMMAGVSDALTPTFLVTLTGGGAIHSPAYCNGSAWVSF